MERKYDVSGGIGKLWSLFLVFLALKLADYIEWSWVWVFAPLWVIPAVVLALFFVAYLLGVFVRRTNAWSRAQMQAKYAARAKKKDIEDEYEKLP